MSFPVLGAGRMVNGFMVANRRHMKIHATTNKESSKRDEKILVGQTLVGLGCKDHATRVAFSQLDLLLTACVEIWSSAVPPSKPCNIQEKKSHIYDTIRSSLFEFPML